MPASKESGQRDTPKPEYAGARGAKRSAQEKAATDKPQSDPLKPKPESKTQAGEASGRAKSQESESQTADTKGYGFRPQTETYSEATGAPRSDPAARQTKAKPKPAASPPKDPRARHRAKATAAEPTATEAPKGRSAADPENLAPLPGPVIPPLLFLLTAFAIWGGAGGLSLIGFDYADLLPTSKEETTVTVFTEGELPDLGDPVPLKPKATQDAFQEWLNEGGL